MNDYEFMNFFVQILLTGVAHALRLIFYIKTPSMSVIKNFRTRTYRLRQKISVRLLQKEAEKFKKNHFFQIIKTRPEGYNYICPILREQTRTNGFRYKYIKFSEVWYNASHSNPLNILFILLNRLINIDSSIKMEWWKKDQREE